MQMINNPVIPGMAPDPSIIRVHEDYYLATSSFHWNPGIPIYHSRDLANWKLVSYALQDGAVNLQGTNTPAGIWAPHLSYDEKREKFYLVYSHLQNMAGREFNGESYLMEADSIEGPWSMPRYLTSIGFDPSLFHDEDGKHYLAVLEWETRLGYQAPGHLVIAQVEPETGKLLSSWMRVSQGFTSRGCVEAPQIYKHDGYYYLLAASGGTGYGHGVEIGRSKYIFGPYEPNPTGEPIITSSPRHLFSLGDPDAGHFEMYNPNSIMQKAGHASLVQTLQGEWYAVHLMSRPLPGATLNPLGRETSLQKMAWTKDGWLQMADGSNLAKMTTPAPQGIQISQRSTEAFDIHDDFRNGSFSPMFMTPYHGQDESWLKAGEEGLRIYGRNSLFSQVNPSIMATRATSFDYILQTKVTFQPDHYSETVGMGLYYDSNNWLYIHLRLDQKERKVVLGLLQARCGTRLTHDYSEVDVPLGQAEIRLSYKWGIAKVEYRLNAEDDWQLLVSDIDVRYLSDEGVNGEPGEIGGFTGLFNFIGAVDAHQHDSYGEFSYYRVLNIEQGE